MKAITYISYFLISVLFALNASALRWSPIPQNGEVVYTCADSYVTMAWNYTLEQGEFVSSTAWNFQGRSQEMVAIFSQGNFFATPSFSQRVQFLPDSGIILSHVTKGDSGNFSVTVTGHDSSGSSFETRRTVWLQVADALMTTDHELHAEQQAVAEFNNVTQQFHAVLTCGRFTYVTEPPVSVEWLTPEGQTVPSTLYSGGLFKLLLHNPVSPGTYSCKISASTHNLSCSHGHGQQANVTVDGVVTRLALMEARLAEKDVVINQLTTSQQTFQAKQVEKDVIIGQLNTSLDQLTTNQQTLQAKQAEKDVVIDQLTTNQQTLEAKQAEKDIVIDQLTTKNADLTTKVQNMEDCLQALKNHTPAAIAFSVRLSGGQQPAYLSTLVLTDVLINEGAAYNSSTGRFTAPLSGTYYFSAFAMSFNSHYAVMTLQSNSAARSGDLFTSYAYNAGNYHYQTGSLQGALSLQQGEEVWLVSASSNNYFNGGAGTSFSGFLLFVE